VNAKLHGLYLITDNGQSSGQALFNKVDAAIQGGARIVQYRDKSDDQARRQQESQALLALCQQHQIPFIINDDVELAHQIGADGVHIGREDGALAHARAKLGNRIIGVSCYNDWDLARSAEKEGADYVAFGAFFNSSTKPNASNADIKLLVQAKQALTIPVVAIGGITPDNGANLINAGANMLAVVNGVFGHTQVQSAAQRYAELFI